eukprot:snap_masked-scaffold_10-processed-gene-8.13-mRNA-1 protein AED:1.00 eAED:1.00 QI:0/-1/0/0/-1/1/1/0/104
MKIYIVATAEYLHMNLIFIRYFSVKAISSLRHKQQSSGQRKANGLSLTSIGVYKATSTSDKKTSKSKKRIFWHRKLPTKSSVQAKEVAVRQSKYNLGEQNIKGI